MEVNLWLDDFYAPEVIKFTINEDMEDGSTAPFTSYFLEESA